MSSTIRKRSLFPKRLSDTIEPLTRPLLKSQGLAGSRIVAEWQHITGSGLAVHCIPEKLSFPPGKKSNGTLTIAVEQGFSLEVQHMQPIILERINSYFGYKAVARLSIAHSYAPPPPVKPKPRAVNMPLTTQAMAALDDVEDEELKTTLASLANALADPTI